MKTAKVKITQYFEIPVAKSHFYPDVTVTDMKGILSEWFYDYVVRVPKLSLLEEKFRLLEESNRTTSKKQKRLNKIALNVCDEWIGIIENAVLSHEVILPDGFDTKVKRKKK